MAFHNALAAGIIWDPREPPPPELLMFARHRPHQAPYGGIRRHAANDDGAEVDEGFRNLQRFRQGREDRPPWNPRLNPDDRGIRQRRQMNRDPVREAREVRMRVDEEPMSDDDSEVEEQPIQDGAQGIPDFVVRENNRNVLPPLSVSVEAQIVQDTAKVTLTQLFWNNSDTPIVKGAYTYPLPAGCTVTQFRCRVGTNRMIHAKVKPKPEAREAFQAAVDRGRTAGLVEQDTPEIFTTTLGNVPPHTKMRAELTFVMLLKHRFGDVDGLGKSTTTFTLPTYIAARYGPPPPEYQRAIADEIPKGLSLKLEIMASETVKRVVSNTHQISVERRAGPAAAENWDDLLAANNADAVQVMHVELEDGPVFLDKDFVVDIIAEPPNNIETPQAWLETHPTMPNHKAVMLTIPPRFMLKTGTPNAPHLQDGEVLFVADRSGSMSDKMASLKSAMHFFVKGIPQGRHFNVWSFGSGFSSLWPRSVEYNEHNLSAALDHIDRDFHANMGGTALMKALEAIFNARDKTRMTDIVVLTDGQVWQMQDTIDLVQKTRELSEGMVRVFSLGVGNAVSHALVEGLAKAGGGYAEVIPAASQGGWEDRVVAMAQAALTKHIGPIEIEYEGHDGSQKSLSKLNSDFSPADILTLSPFLRNRVFALLPDGVVQQVAKLNLKTLTIQGVEICTPVELNPLPKKDTTLHSLTARAVLGDLEQGRGKIHIEAGHAPPGSHEDRQRTRTEGERIGCQWSLVSKWTSFFLEEEVYEPLEHDPFMDGVIEVRGNAQDMGLLRPRGGNRRRGLGMGPAGGALALAAADAMDIDGAEQASDDSDSSTEDELQHDSTDQDSDDGGGDGGDGAGNPGPGGNTDPRGNDANLPGPDPAPDGQNPPGDNQQPPPRGGDGSGGSNQHHQPSQQWQQTPQMPSLRIANPMGSTAASTLPTEATGATLSMEVYISSNDSRNSPQPGAPESSWHQSSSNEASGMDRIGKTRYSKSFFNTTARGGGSQEANSSPKPSTSTTKGRRGPSKHKLTKVEELTRGSSSQISSINPPVAQASNSFASMRSSSPANAPGSTTPSLTSYGQRPSNLPAQSQALEQPVSQEGQDSDITRQYMDNFPGLDMSWDLPLDMSLDLPVSGPPGDPTSEQYLDFSSSFDWEFGTDNVSLEGTNSSTLPANSDRTVAEARSHDMSPLSAPTTSQPSLSIPSVSAPPPGAWDASYSASNSPTQSYQPLASDRAANPQDFERLTASSQPPLSEAPRASFSSVVFPTRLGSHSPTPTTSDELRSFRTGGLMGGYSSSTEAQVSPSLWASSSSEAAVSNFTPPAMLIIDASLGHSQIRPRVATSRSAHSTSQSYQSRPPMSFASQYGVAPSFPSDMTLSPVQAPSSNLPASSNLIVNTASGATQETAEERQKKDFVRQLLGLQRYDGSFSAADRRLEELLGSAIERSLTDSFPSVTQHAELDVLYTAAVIVLLERDFQSCRELWQLLVEKAQAAVKGAASGGAGLVEKVEMAIRNAKAGQRDVTGPKRGLWGARRSRSPAGGSPPKRRANFAFSKNYPEEGRRAGTSESNPATPAETTGVLSVGTSAIGPKRTAVQFAPLED